MRRRLAAALAAALLLGGVTACDGGVPGPGRSDVDVDTPQLREQKAAAGIEDCVPGTGASDLPSLTLPCLGGGPDVDLSTLTGPVLLNVWYSACAPCRNEMPVLQQFHEQYGDQVPLIGIDTETTPSSGIGFAGEVGATYPQLADPGGDIFGDEELRLVQAAPQTIFVDGDGDIATIAATEIKSVEELVDLVETHLGITLTDAP
ncbi:TlpA disulfide reductase family protein [Nocardioides sp. C4-1]|uniref:TlpA family protein disulfide reductase n=1 Tax=Nocardioides sp. C4-1 TaxID=3151851 RepID=UPI003267D346